MANIPILGKLVSATEEGILADAAEIECGISQKLGDVLPTVMGQTAAVVPASLLTQEQYDALVEGGTVDPGRLYLIYEEDEA